MILLGASASAQEAPPKPEALAHLRVDREQRVVDIDAKVVLREGEWIELLACTPGTREHEAILTVDAQPSHIHLALIMIGLEPGAPMSWRKDGEKTAVTPPKGPKVSVWIVTTVDGKTVETPASEWVLNQEAKTVLADNHWVFAGSGFAEWQGKRVYRADAGGTVISLVNFGDDMLARPTEMTNQNDNAAWAANTKAIPAIGTKVILRLKPVAEAKENKPAPPAS